MTTHNTTTATPNPVVPEWFPSGSQNPQNLNKTTPRWQARRVVPGGSLSVGGNHPLEPFARVVPKTSGTTRNHYPKTTPKTNHTKQATGDHMSNHQNTPRTTLTSAERESLLCDLGCETETLVAGHLKHCGAAGGYNVHIDPDLLVERVEQILSDRAAKESHHGHVHLNGQCRGDLVLDTCAGSGSTMIAADRLGRRAALVELDPAYADVICHRWQNHAGTKPIHLSRAGNPIGKAHDFSRPA